MYVDPRTEPNGYIVEIRLNPNLIVEFEIRQTDPRRIQGRDSRLSGKKMEGERSPSYGTTVSDGQKFVTRRRLIKERYHEIEDFT